MSRVWGKQLVRLYLTKSLLADPGTEVLYPPTWLALGVPPLLVIPLLILVGMAVPATKTLIAMEDSLPHSEEAMERLDRLLLLVPDVSNGDDVSLVGPFIVADWRERNGDLEGALASRELDLYREIGYDVVPCSAVSGDFSEGLRITLLPVASAGPIFQAAMSSGKFQGMICPATPSAFGRRPGKA